MKIPASIAKHKSLIGIGAAVLSVAAFGAVALAVYEGHAPAPSAVEQPLATSEPATDAAPTNAPAPARSLLKKVVGDVARTSATYLGVSPQDLATQLRSGKSLAEIADATAGKSRDGLVAALTTAANANLGAAAQSGTLSADQVATAKKRLPDAIARIVDHAGVTRS
jgi:hypothetical protein